MIVEPGFLEHHKTQTLVRLSGDEAAPLAVLRLWGYCQDSRRWEFPDMTEEMLATLCRWKSEKVSCHEAMIRSGYLRRIGRRKGFAAHQWEEKNGQLIQKWEAGRKSGGRPKEGSKKGAKTEGDKSSSETGRKPVGFRSKSDQTRSDQIREEPIGNSGGTGEGVEGGSPAATGEQASSAKGGVSGGGDEVGAGDGLAVPVFEPLRPGLFPPELDGMLEGARKEMSRVRRLDEAWVWSERERPGYAEDVAWHVSEIAACGDPGRLEKLRREASELEGQRMERVKVKLNAQAVRVLAAWEKRVKEIERAKKGIEG